jgi:hypothetical protein
MINHLKIDVKRLELEVNKLKKQTKVQTTQDNRRNMLKKFGKGTTTSKITSQQHNKSTHHMKQERNSMDEKIEYARNAYLNPRWPHIKSGIGYRTGDKHNTRMNTNGQEFIKFTKATTHQEKRQNTKITNNASYAYTNASHVSHMSYHEFDVSYILMRNKLRKVIDVHVGTHHKKSKTCVWVPKCLVTNLRGHNQTWVPTNKA